MSNRFDLEQQIMHCWNIAGELDLLAEEVLKNKLSNDELATILSGLAKLYDLKFDQCFLTLEKCIANKEI